MADSEILSRGEKTDSVKPWLLGAEPPITFAKITTISTRISSTEIPSMPSSDRVATRMSPNARIAKTTIAISARISQSKFPGADAVEEALAEQPDLGRRRDREQRVRPHQPEAGEEAGARAERGPGEREHRAGRVEMTRQPDEPVRDEHHADRGDQERERHRPPDQPGDRGPVERHRGGRRHDRQRQRDRFDEAQLPAEPLLLGAHGGSKSYTPRRRSRARLPAGQHGRVEPEAIEDPERLVADLLRRAPAKDDQPVEAAVRVAEREPVFDRLRPIAEAALDVPATLLGNCTERGRGGSGSRPDCAAACRRAPGSRRTRRPDPSLPAPRSACGCRQLPVVERKVAAENNSRGSARYGVRLSADSCQPGAG